MASGPRRTCIRPARGAVAAAGLAALAFFAFGAARRCGFVRFDDDVYVFENPRVAAGLTAEGTRWAFATGHAANWHPLTRLSHMADMEWYGLRPAGHHLTSLLLHAANAILPFWVLRGMTGRFWPALLAAAFFAGGENRPDPDCAGVQRGNGGMKTGMDLHFRAFHLSGRRTELGLAGLLLVVTLALFWPAQGFDYIHLDDIPYVVENPILAEGLTWTGVRQAFTTVWQQWWLPLLWISYLADLAVFGAGPHGHHLVNILLHAANAALLFWALVRLTGRRWPCFFVAALFAWHPTRVEAVAWITARKDMLSGLFFMLALLAYSRHVRRPSAVRMAAVAGCMLAGLLSKAILIVLPPLLLVLDYWPLKRTQRLWGHSAWREWKPLLLEKTPLIVLAAVFMAINLRTHVSGTGAELALPAATRLGLIAPNVMAYLRILAVPVRLNVIYPDSNVVVWPVSLGAAVLLLAATLAGMGQRKSRPWLLAGWMWFLVGLLPVLRGVRLGLAQYADRFTYLPLIGLGIALAWTVAEWARGPRRCRVAGVLGAVVLGLCLIRTQGQLRWWRDSLTLLSRAVHLAPDAAAAHLGLGNALFEKGRIEEAEVHFRETVRLYPWDEMHWANWGMALVLRGRAEEAHRLLSDHVRDSTNRTPLLHAAYGMACLHLGDRDTAIRHLRRELEIRPMKGYRVELIRALFEKGAEEEAQNEAAGLTEWPGGAIRSAMDLFPFYLQRWRDGAQPYAWGFFRRLAEREPENAALLNNAAWLAATDPEAPAEAVAEAVGLARRAVALTGGDDAAILSTLAVALAAAGDFKGAAETGRRALALADAQGDAPLAERTRARLRLFQESKPYRE